jgi:hypothetical protein
MSRSTLHSNDASFAVAGLGLIVALVIIGAGVGAWLTMIGLSILHTHFMSAIPALGIKDSFWTMVGLWLVVGLPSVGSRVASSN